MLSEEAGSRSTEGPLKRSSYGGVEGGVGSRRVSFSNLAGLSVSSGQSQGKSDSVWGGIHCHVMTCGQLPVVRGKELFTAGHRGIGGLVHSTTFLWLQRLCVGGI